MKSTFENLKSFLHENREDLEYLLFVGFPGGIIIVLLTRSADFSNLF